MEKKLYLRKDAWQLAADLGAVPESSVTGSTNVLVIGDGFTGHDASEFQSAKAMKAVKLRAKGKDVEILNEQDFRTLVEERFTAGLRN
jgi:DNA polymerase-3 subunit epsilon